MVKTSAKKAANERPKPPKCGTLMGIKGVSLERVIYEFSQDSDSCQDNDNGQSLTVSTDDGGGGSYIVISTERWAVDYDDIDKFTDTLKRIVNLPEGYEDE